MQILKSLSIATLLLAAARSATAQDLPGRPHGPEGTVTLSLTEYNRLVDLASRPTRPPDVAPVAAVLSRASLRVRVDGGAARGVFDLEGQVLRAGTTRVRLISGATIIDARAAGQPLPLAPDGNDHTALLPGPGPFSLTLEWGAPLTLAPGRGSFVLPVPAAGSAGATIDVPGENTDVHVSAGLVTRRASAQGRTIVDVTLDPGSATDVWWSMRESAPAVAAREVRTLADVMTLVTLGESDVKMVALIDVTVVQGEPRSIEVRLPPGYEMTGVTGSSLEYGGAGLSGPRSSEERRGTLVLAVANPAARRHQFLVSLERAHGGGSFSLETGVASLPAAQRERGEIGIESIGTLELGMTEREGLRRIDVRELNPALLSLARQPLAAAFRYQRGAAAAPTLTLDVRRFADAAVLAAVAERAVATTLVTSEGRALTEVSLWLQNRAQPFLKVALPAGASIVSVEVAGAPAKPAHGPDGTRVPLLRPGFRPNGTYAVSFVYLHAGTPFARKGDMQMTLPRMDIPVGIVEWELFVPDRYSASRFDGNAIAAHFVHEGAAATAGFGGDIAFRAGGALMGQIVGQAKDDAGAVIPGVTVTVEGAGIRRQVVTDANGSFVVSNLPSGPLTVTGELEGFKTVRRSFVFDQRPRQADLRMEVGGLQETVTVTADTPMLDTRSSERSTAFRTSDEAPRRDAAKAPAPPAQAAPSANVINLQRRAAGVLPVRVEVPRAGASHRFVKPLVVDQETIVSFRYKRK